MQTTEDVFEGRWEANRDRSDLDPNHRFQQATMNLRRTPDGYELRAEGIGPDGQPCVEGCTLVLDVTAHAEPRSPGTTVLATRSDERTLRVEAKMGERMVGEAKYQVSADGRSLTAETSGTDAQGRAFKTRVVFDRLE